LVRTRPYGKRTGVESGKQQSKWKGVDWIHEGCDRDLLKALVNKAMNFCVTYTEWNSWLGDVWYVCL